MPRPIAWMTREDTPDHDPTIISIEPFTRIDGKKHLIARDSLT
jgi:hypothetical protein